MGVSLGKGEGGGGGRPELTFRMVHNTFLAPSPLFMYRIISNALQRSYGGQLSHGPGYLEK